MNKKLHVGGQAVIEGVMMRAKNTVSVAVRLENNDIVLDKQEFISIAEKIKIFKWPLLRGIVILIESFILGIKALSFSAVDTITITFDAIIGSLVSDSFGRYYHIAHLFSTAGYAEPPPGFFLIILFDEALHSWYTVYQMMNFCLNFTHDNYNDRGM